MLRALAFLSITAIAIVALGVLTNTPGYSIESSRAFGELIGAALTIIAIGAIAAGITRLVSRSENAPAIAGCLLAIAVGVMNFIGGWQ